jgi:hypothetical protein
MNADERAVFELEVSRNDNSTHLKRFVGDSLLVNRSILPYQKTFGEFKSWCIATKTLNEQEADEIFGSKPDKLFRLKHDGKEWTSQDFQRRIVSLFVESEPRQQNLGFFGTLSISVPVIRKDKKYALIQVDNIQEGGLLRVYKKTSQGWIFYKTINLYVT